MFINYVVGLLLVLVVLCFMYYIFMGKVLQLIEADETANEDTFNDPMQLVFARNGIVDCNNTRLPCVTDRQCIDNCVLQLATGRLECDNGFCVNRDANIAGRPETETQLDCDIALGLIRVFAASEFVVSQTCISTYRDIVDDLGSIRPYVCSDGTLDIDLSVRQFSPADCKCNPNYTKMIFNQTAFARSVPVCIPNSRAAVYSKIYENV
ncbi:Pif3 [Ectropis obliqua nucleopolyhedrovirus]|uniref:Pif3 n=1 Tax=Ectropis obliqua nucleopolyhedrovirus TaxID=59376 RepID=A0EZ14_9ABAC|nr:Pif3 [Ectropis obliqua nucleopolyhedrovirus]ABI35794.1 Pif3 [Ectropis obliqua nucleopolyhedrovirus]AGS47955.1 putative 23.0 kDa protein [Ectropis obliqua nucleopolyhedrovirus]QWV59622.1 Pif3 [Ectropis obliqua nucleopolyhedrovirus]UYO72907.1 Pif3 [Ectropis obliqua nucleopolyhedrovirus]